MRKGSIRLQGGCSIKDITIQAMVNDLLTKYRIYTAQDENKCVNPNVKSVNKILKPYSKKELRKKIGVKILDYISSDRIFVMELIKLYCKTKFYKKVNKF